LQYRLRSIGDFRVAVLIKPLQTISRAYAWFPRTPRNTAATYRFAVCSHQSDNAESTFADANRPQPGPNIRLAIEPEPSTINEKTIADFTRVVEQTGDFCSARDARRWRWLDPDRLLGLQVRPLDDHDRGQMADDVKLSDLEAGYSPETALAQNRVQVRPVPLFRAAKLPPTFFDERFRVRSNVDPASIFEPFSSYALRTLAIRDWRPHCFGLAFSGRLWRDWPIVLPAHH
jgi:hypothetical protein